MCKFLNITLVPLLTFGKIFNTELDVKANITNCKI